MMEHPTEGGCYCGAVRYRFTGHRLKRLCCHCRSCQRQSGGPMMAYVVVKAKDFALVSGEPRCFASSADGQRCFCPECGSALFFKHASRPEWQIVAAASLDGFHEFAPETHIWTDSAVTWLRRSDSSPLSPAQLPEARSG